MVWMVIDGQGGGIGVAVIKRLRKEFGFEPHIVALGTNPVATSNMMKAGANRGATGENAIIQTTPRAVVIIGPIAIIMAHAMMGELTPKMAEAVSSSPARKILIPLTQENVRIVGIQEEPLPHLVDQVVKLMKEEEIHV